MTIKYVGLDFETTGSDPWGAAVPIQIGMAIGDLGFSCLIGGWQFDNYNDPANSHEWSEEAFGIHGIPREDVQRAAPAWVVDVLAAAWLVENVGWSNRMFHVTVGWNVGGFDRQFVTRWMPATNRLLSYRTVDLNSLVFSKAVTEEEYLRLKSAAKDYANERLSITEEHRHDALVDARSALLEMEYLTSL